MAAQLHGFESAAQVQKVKSEVRTVFKAVTAGSESFQDAGEFGADAILVDSDEPGSGEVFDWQMAENAPQESHSYLQVASLHRMWPEQ